MSTKYNIKTEQVTLTADWQEWSVISEDVRMHTNLLLFTPHTEMHVVRGHDVPTEDNYFPVPQGGSINFDRVGNGNIWLRVNSTNKIYVMGG